MTGDARSMRSEAGDAALRGIVDGAETFSASGGNQKAEDRAGTGGIQGSFPAMPSDESAGERVELRPIDLAAWHGRKIPHRQWLVRDWIPMGYASSMYGDGGAGKTQLAQMLQTSCAIGRPWIGLETCQCPSVGLYAEDDEHELVRRQDGINRAAGIAFSDISKQISIIPRIGEDNFLMVFDRRGRGELTPVWHALLAEAKRIKARLVIIDTAADTFGGDEIRRSEVRQFIALSLGRLAREINGAVLLLAHPSLSGLKSGEGTGASTAWNNSVRARLYLTRPEAEEGAQIDRDLRILSRKKANYAGIGDEMSLRWQDGVFRIAGRPTGDFVEVIDQRNRERDVEDIFLTCLREVQASGRYASDSTASRDKYAPKLFRRLKAAHGCSVKDLTSAMDRLLDTGRIRVEGVLHANRNHVAAIVEVVSA